MLPYIGYMDRMGHEAKTGPLEDRNRNGVPTASIHCWSLPVVFSTCGTCMHLRVALFRRWWAIIAQTLVSECGLGTGQAREWPKENPTNPGVIQRNAWPDHVISQLEPSVLGIHHEHREMITAGKSSVHRWIFHELILDTSHFHVTIGIPSGYLQ